jgi:hypothetical protein
MEHGTWQANSGSASQEIPRLFPNTSIPFRVHRNPPTVPILSQSIQPPPSKPTPYDLFQYYPPTRASVLCAVYSLQVSEKEPMGITHSYNACYIPTHIILAVRILTIDLSSEDKLWSSSSNIFSRLLPLHPSCAKYTLQQPQARQLVFFPLKWEIKFRTDIKQHVKL